jgi:hypothetical protein
MLLCYGALINFMVRGMLPEPQNNNNKKTVANAVTATLMASAGVDQFRRAGNCDIMLNSLLTVFGRTVHSVHQD